METFEDLTNLINLFEDEIDIVENYDAIDQLKSFITIPGTMDKRIRKRKKQGLHGNHTKGQSDFYSVYEKICNHVMPEQLAILMAQRIAEQRAELIVDRSVLKLFRRRAKRERSMSRFLGQLKKYNVRNQFFEEEILQTLVESMQVVDLQSVVNVRGCIYNEPNTL